MKKVSVAFSSAGPVPPSLKRNIVAAAQAAMRGIPRPLFTKKTGKAQELSISIALLGPTAVKKLNRRYRKKNRTTDVLSFSRMEGFSLPTIHQEIGEVILCLAVARRQAKWADISLKEEIQRLTIHGVLHLFGYDHETNARDAKKMFSLQEKILSSL